MKKIFALLLALTIALSAGAWASSISDRALEMARKAAATVATVEPTAEPAATAEPIASAAPVVTPAPIASAEPVAETPVPTAEPTGEPLEIYFVRADGGLRVHVAPEINSDVTMTAPDGQEVTVLERQDGFAFVRFDYGGQTIEGWVSEDYLSK